MELVGQAMGFAELPLTSVGLGDKGMFSLSFPEPGTHAPKRIRQHGPYQAKFTSEDFSQRIYERCPCEGHASCEAGSPKSCFLLDSVLPGRLGLFGRWLFNFLILPIDCKGFDRRLQIFKEKREQEGRMKEKKEING